MFLAGTGGAYTVEPKQANLGLITRKALEARGQLVPTEVTEETPRLVTRIAREDEKDLRWYFAEERTRALSGGGSSNFAAALERLERFSGHVVACVHCGGTPERRDPESGELIAEEVPGTGFVVSGYAFKEWRRLARDGRHRDEVQAWLDRHSPRRRETVDPVTGKREAVVQGDVNCPKCCDPKIESHKWTPGWVVRSGRRSHRRVTVRITAEVQATPAVDGFGGSDSTERLARVGRQLDAILAVDARVAVALELFYSPDGGSAAALWCLTEAGRSLFKDNRLGLPQQEYFRALRTAQETNQASGMTARFRQAERQAADLLRRTGEIWNEVVHPEGATPPPEPRQGSDVAA